MEKLETQNCNLCEKCIIGEVHVVESSVIIDKRGNGDILVHSDRGNVEVKKKITLSKAWAKPIVFFFIGAIIAMFVTFIVKILFLDVKAINIIASLIFLMLHVGFLAFTAVILVKTVKNYSNYRKAQKMLYNFADYKDLVHIKGVINLFAIFTMFVGLMAIQLSILLENDVVLMLFPICTGIALALWTLSIFFTRSCRKAMRKLGAAVIRFIKAIPRCLFGICIAVFITAVFACLAALVIMLMGLIASEGLFTSGRWIFSVGAWAIAGVILVIMIVEARMIEKKLLYEDMTKELLCMSVINMIAVIAAPIIIPTWLWLVSGILLGLATSLWILHNEKTKKMFRDLANWSGLLLFIGFAGILVAMTGAAAYITDWKASHEILTCVGVSLMGLSTIAICIRTTWFSWLIMKQSLPKFYYILVLLLLMCVAAVVITMLRSGFTDAVFILSLVSSGFTGWLLAIERPWA